MNLLPEGTRRAVAGVIRRGLRMHLGNERTPDMADLVLSVAEFTADGDDDHGWRVRMSDMGSAATSSIVVKRPAGSRVLAAGDQRHEVASEAWRRVDRGDVEGARRCSFDEPAHELHATAVD